MALDEDASITCETVNVSDSTGEHEQAVLTCRDAGVQLLIWLLDRWTDLIERGELPPGEHDHFLGCYPDFLGVLCVEPTRANSTVQHKLTISYLGSRENPDDWSEDLADGPSKGIFAECNGEFDIGLTSEAVAPTVAWALSAGAAG